MGLKLRFPPHHGAAPPLAEPRAAAGDIPWDIPSCLLCDISREQTRPGEQVRAPADSRVQERLPPGLLGWPRQPSLTSARRKTTPVSLRDLAIKDAKDKTLSSNHWF